MFDPSGYSVPPFAVIFWRSGSVVNDSQARPLIATLDTQRIP
jgi:hypothetical protein